jgi:hypothetical protein
MSASMNTQSALSAALKYSMETASSLKEQTTSDQPQLPQELLLMLRCITRSSQHALRSHAWLQVVNAAIQAWNALRSVRDCAPCAITMHAGNSSSASTSQSEKAMQGIITTALSMSELITQQRNRRLGVRL